jgi:tetratricopeptide (TPR) repeat protein
VGKVWALSEGSPFVIVETMRALREGLPPTADVELPRRVRDMIAARLERLSARAQEVARVAAVFPRDFEFPVLQRAAGFVPRETAEAIEELVRRRIFDAVGERFDFTHARIRQAVYQNLLGPRRQAIHAAVGDAVESVYAGRLEEVYDRLAYHFGRAEEPSRALTYCVHLADKVARGYALDEAVRILQEALACADRVPVAERDRRRLDVVYRLAHMLLLLGRSGDARDLLLAHEATAARVHDPSLSGAFHFWLAYALGNLGAVDAYAHAKRGLEEAARCGDEVVMGRASFALAREAYMMGRALEGIAHARQSVALLERHHDTWWLGQAVYILSLNLLHIGDFGSVLEAVERGRVIAEAWGDRRLEAHVAGIAARVHTVMGDVETAIAAGDRAYELAGDPVTRLAAVAWLGAACQEGGETARAIELIEGALKDLSALSGGGGYRYRQVDPFLRATLAEAYLDHGDPVRAHDAAAAALPVATAGGWAVAIGYAARALARCARANGKLAEAEAAARQALTTFGDSAARAQVARTRLTLAEILVARGQQAAASAELAAAREAFVHMRVPRLIERTDRLAKTLGLSLAA